MHALVGLRQQAQCSDSIKAARAGSFCGHVAASFCFFFGNCAFFNLRLVKHALSFPHRGRVSHKHSIFEPDRPQRAKAVR